MHDHDVLLSGPQLPYSKDNRIHTCSYYLILYLWIFDWKGLRPVLLYELRGIRVSECKISGKITRAYLESTVHDSSNIRYLSSLTPIHIRYSYNLCQIFTGRRAVPCQNIIVIFVASGHLHTGRNKGFHVRKINLWRFVHSISACRPSSSIANEFGKCRR